MRFAVVFRNFEEIHISKDVGGIPIAISKSLSSTPIIYYSGKIQLNHHRLEFKNFYKKNKMIFYLCVLKDLIKEDIDVVNLYHLNSETLYFALLLKLLGKKVYIKSDINFNDAEVLKKYFEREYFKLNPLILRLVDLISVESREIFENFKGIKFLSKRLMYLPNTITVKDLNVLDWRQKDNNILVVARHGCPIKNTEVILQALLGITDLSSWNIYFIGTATEDFLNKLDDLIRAKGTSFSIKYINHIKNTELLEFYNKSKVFLMTSNSEAFSIAMSEAAAFGCQIISTHVAGYDDLTDNGKYGISIEKNSVESTRNAIEGIVNSRLLLTNSEWENYRNYIKSNMDYDDHISELLRRLNNL